MQSKRSVGAFCSAPKGSEAAGARICHQFCCFYNGIQLHFEQWTLFALRSLHRNPFYCQQDLQNCTETRFTATGQGRLVPKPVSLPAQLGPRTLFRTSSRAVWPRSSLRRLAALRHLSPSAFSAFPLPYRSMWAPSLRECSSNVALAHPPAEEPIAHRVVGVAGPVGHGRRGRFRTPAPGHRPCTQSQRRWVRPVACRPWGAPPR